MDLASPKNDATGVFVPPAVSTIPSVMQFTCRQGLQPVTPESLPLTRDLHDGRMRRRGGMEASTILPTFSEYILSKCGFCRCDAYALLSVPSSIVSPTSAPAQRLESFTPHHPPALHLGVVQKIKNALPDSRG
jgi:hypothetical protein